MRAGQLRYRVGIQTVTHTRDAIGGVTEAWATVANRWANIEPVSAREFIQAGLTQSDMTHKVTLRNYDGLIGAQRVLWGTRVFHIVAVLDGLAETVLLCKEFVAQIPAEQKSSSSALSSSSSGRSSSSSGRSSSSSSLNSSSSSLLSSSSSALSSSSSSLASSSSSSSL